MATRKPRRPRRQKAVIDRVEDGKWAVLLVGRQEFERIVHVDQLPQGARAGSWLKVRVEDDKVSDIAVDEAETRAAQRRVSSKLEQLRQRGAHFKPVPASEVQDGSNQLRNPPPHAAAPDEAAREAGAETAERHDAGSDDATPKLLTGPVRDSGGAAGISSTPADDDAPEQADDAAT